MLKCLYSDVIEGEGVEAREGDIVEVNYVCRRSNGYFVYRYDIVVANYGQLWSMISWAMAALLLQSIK